MRIIVESYLGGLFTLSGQDEPYGFTLHPEFTVVRSRLRPLDGARFHEWEIPDGTLNDIRCFATMCEYGVIVTTRGDDLYVEEREIDYRT